MRVLLIDDNREIALLTAELLRQHGQTVEVAFGGDQGCRRAKDFQPEVVVCDLNLGGESGFETAKRLRRDAGANPPLLIGITADTTVTLQEHVSQTPFDVFLSKPLAWPQFRQCFDASNARGLLMNGSTARTG